MAASAATAASSAAAVPSAARRFTDAEWRKLRIRVANDIDPEGGYYNHARQQDMKRHLTEDNPVHYHSWILGHRVRRQLSSLYPHEMNLREESYTPQDRAAVKLWYNLFNEVHYFKFSAFGMDRNNAVKQLTMNLMACYPGAAELTAAASAVAAAAGRVDREYPQYTEDDLPDMWSHIPTRMLDKMVIYLGRVLTGEKPTPDPKSWIWSDDAGHALLAVLKEQLLIRKERRRNARDAFAFIQSGVVRALKRSVKIPDAVVNTIIAPMVSSILEYDDLVPRSVVHPYLRSLQILNELEQTRRFTGTAPTTVRDQILALLRDIIGCMDKLDGRSVREQLQRMRNIAATDGFFITATKLDFIASSAEFMGRETTLQTLVTLEEKLCVEF
jgi:hypothetical protein